MKKLKNILPLAVLTVVFVAILVVTNHFTAPIIEENAAASANGEFLVVMPEGEGFTPVDLTQYQLPETVIEAYSEASGGCVVKLQTNGYAADLVVLVGVNAAGEVTGATCVSSNETLGAEATYGEKVVGATADTIEAVDTVAGVTMTTKAYRDCVKDAINTQIILGGGSVDVRSEEQIIADTLPAGAGAFTLTFIPESLTSIDAVYVADNGAGYVFVSGEEYIGVDSTGAVVSEVAEDVKATMQANASVVMASSVTEIDITGYADMPPHVAKAYKTASGNYVFDLEARGFGINGDHYYSPSGECIQIKVAISAEGQIIACQTMYENETDNIGDACAKPEFYGQFVGKDATNCGEIDAITGATITTNGYKTAIAKAFEAFEMVKGA